MESPTPAKPEPPTEGFFSRAIHTVKHLQKTELLETLDNFFHFSQSAENEFLAYLSLRRQNPEVLRTTREADWGRDQGSLTSLSSRWPFRVPKAQGKTSTSERESASSDGLGSSPDVKKAPETVDVEEENKDVPNGQDGNGGNDLWPITKGLSLLSSFTKKDADSSLRNPLDNHVRAANCNLVSPADSAEILAESLPDTDAYQDVEVQATFHGCLPEEAEHLVVLQHGLHGNERDFTYLKWHLLRSFQGEPIFVHATSCNTGKYTTTHDGIDFGGKRLAQEVEEVAATLPKLRKISIIAHSLGGLYSRYAIGVLYSKGFFTKYEPMNFVTFASPHMGVRRPSTSIVNKVFNTVAGQLFDRTGEQLVLNDTASPETVELTRHDFLRSTPAIYKSGPGAAATGVQRQGSEQIQHSGRISKAGIFAEVHERLSGNVFEQRKDFLCLSEVQQTLVSQMVADLREQIMLQKSKSIKVNSKEHFTGKDFVAWAVRAGWVGTRTEGVLRGQQLLDAWEISPAVDGTAVFVDGFAMYRLVDPVNLQQVDTNSVTDVAASGWAAVATWLEMRRAGVGSGFLPYYCMLLLHDGTSLLLIYESDGGAMPVKLVKIQQGAVCVIEELENVTLMELHADNAAHMFRCADRRIIDFWLPALENAGVDVLGKSLDQNNPKLDQVVEGTQSQAFKMIADDSDFYDFISTISLAARALLTSRCLASRPSPEYPCTLLCLTRGAFIAGLGKFAARTLYANIFHDLQVGFPLDDPVTALPWTYMLLQVPYNTAAIRVYNPYQNDLISTETSPTYPHITLASTSNAPILRETFTILNTFLSQQKDQVETPNATFSPTSVGTDSSKFTFTESRATISERSIITADQAAMDEDISKFGSPRHANMSKISKAIRAVATFGANIHQLKPGARQAGGGSSRAIEGLPDLVQTEGDRSSGQILMDDLTATFEDDPDRDTLREMYGSLQTLSWRRLDCLFNGLQAHDRIVGKNSHFYHEEDSGIDIVVHLADTLLV